MSALGDNRGAGVHVSAALVMLAAAGSALVVTQSSICAPVRDWLAARPGKPWRLAAKLVACPMCSGFWLGGAWSVIFGTRDAFRFAANGFAGSLAAALFVALWLALGEAYAALGLWRFLKTPEPPEKVAPLRVPRFMVAAWYNPWENHPDPIVCKCGTAVNPGKYHPFVTPCGNEVPAGGTMAYVNFVNRTVVCGCGQAVLPGDGHALTERCGGVTTLDAAIG